MGERNRRMRIYSTKNVVTYGLLWRSINPFGCCLSKRERMLLTGDELSMLDPSEL